MLRHAQLQPVWLQKVQLFKRHRAVILFWGSNSSLWPRPLQLMILQQQVQRQWAGKSVTQQDRDSGQAKVWHNKTGTVGRQKCDTTRHGQWAGKSDTTRQGQWAGKSVTQQDRDSGQAKMWHKTGTRWQAKVWQSKAWTRWQAKVWHNKTGTRWQAKVWHLSLIHIWRCRRWP